MQNSPTTLDIDQMLARIDAAIQELQALRQQLVVPVKATTIGITEQLFGALGRGSWDEYDLDLDWARFDTP